MREEKLYNMAKRSIEGGRFADEIAMNGTEKMELIKSLDAKPQAHLSLALLVGQYLNRGGDKWECINSLAFSVIMTQLSKINKYGEDAYPMSKKQILVIHREMG